MIDFLRKNDVPLLIWRGESGVKLYLYTVIANEMTDEMYAVESDFYEEFSRDWTHE